MIHISSHVLQKVQQAKDGQLQLCGCVISRKQDWRKEVRQGKEWVPRGTLLGGYCLCHLSSDTNCWVSSNHLPARPITALSQDISWGGGAGGKGSYDPLTTGCRCYPQGWCALHPIAPPRSPVPQLHMGSQRAGGEGHREGYHHIAPE